MLTTPVHPPCHEECAIDCMVCFLKEEQKKEAFEGVIAKKLGNIEGILKANNGGNGFFVGDGVCMTVFNAYCSWHFI